MGRIAFTIEDALQENLACHAAWVRLCAKQTNIPVDVQVTGLSGTSGADAPREGIGGDGGKGAWPGGGGGGGGAGPNDTGVGGEGADGAIVLFEYSRDGQLVDVEAFVTPGAFKWICPHGVEFVKVIAIGGGGGGSGCRSVSKAVSSDAIRSCESSADLKNRCLNNSIAAPQPS